jgi:hypothetical protein
MTWVIAHVNPVAVVMLSDIRISIRVGSTTKEITEFGVKKIHHVAWTAFAGFAGSIPLGFASSTIYTVTSRTLMTRT